MMSEYFSEAGPRLSLRVGVSSPPDSQNRERKKKAAATTTIGQRHGCEKECAAVSRSAPRGTGVIYGTDRAEDTGVLASSPFSIKKGKWWHIQDRCSAVLC